MNLVLLMENCPMCPTGCGFQAERKWEAGLQPGSYAESQPLFPGSLEQLQAAQEVASLQEMAQV